MLYLKSACSYVVNAPLSSRFNSKPLAAKVKVKTANSGE